MYNEYNNLQKHKLIFFYQFYKKKMPFNKILTKKIINFGQITNMEMNSYCPILNRTENMIDQNT